MLNDNSDIVAFRQHKILGALVPEKKLKFTPVRVTRSRTNCRLTLFRWKNRRDKFENTLLQKFAKQTRFFLQLQCKQYYSFI